MGGAQSGADDRAYAAWQRALTVGAELGESRKASRPSELGLDTSQDRCVLLRKRIAAVEQEIASQRSPSDAEASRRNATSLPGDVRASDTSQLETLRRQVESLEAELDQKEEVIMRLDRIAADQARRRDEAPRNPP